MKISATFLFVKPGSDLNTWYLQLLRKYNYKRSLYNTILSLQDQETSGKYWTCQEFAKVPSQDTWVSHVPPKSVFIPKSKLFHFKVKCSKLRGRGHFCFVQIKYFVNSEQPFVWSLYAMMPGARFTKLHSCWCLLSFMYLSNTLFHSVFYTTFV